MYCGCNEKALCSQRAIAGALLELMGEERYASVSISALCRRAGVSRPTFYSLFGSMDDVVLYLLRESFRCEPEPGGAAELESMCRFYSRYFTVRRDFLCLLVENGIGHLLYRSIFDSLMDCGCFLAGEEEAPRRHAANFTAGALTGIMQDLVTHEPCGDSELAGLLEELFTGTMFRRQTKKA